MTTIATVLSLLLCFQDSGDAGGKIKWIEDPKAAVEDAKKSARPILFYVLGRSDDRDDDIERDQKRAMADDTVVRLARRFVCCKLSRSRHRDVLEGLGLKSEYQMYMVFVRPDGTLIDQLDGLGVAKTDTLQQKLAVVFRVYRKEYFNKELAPLLSEEKTKAAEIKKAFARIEEFTILDADAAIIALLKRPNVDKSILKSGQELLAALSTKPAVDYLLEAAGKGDEQAAKVLEKCTPGAAENMLPALDEDDEKLRLLVYTAVTKICRVKDAKPARFWEGKNEKVKADEIQRVKNLVEKVARRWKERYEEYR